MRLLTELPKLSSSNIHVSTSERVKDERRAKAKTFSNVLTTQTLVGFAGKGKGKHAGSGKSGTSAHHANLTSVEDFDCYSVEDVDESANAYQAHNDPVDPGSDDGEEAPDYDDDEENDTFSSYVALDDVTVSRQLNWTRLLFLPTRGTMILDPEVSAQLVQASAQAYFSFGKEKGKGKRQSKKARARADILFARHICH